MNPTSRSRDVLLEPFQLRHLTLKNRIISTAHASGLTEDGLPMERYQRYHEEKAKGGIGLTMFGGSSIVGKDSSNVFSQIDITEDRIIPVFQQFSERIHRHGTALMCQITHMGRRGSPYASSWVSTVAPSRIRETLHRSIPREMDQDDIARVVNDYGAAALRCKEGGLDGIETLAGGHLIGQFLSPITNRRTDRYGGSIENRVRFALEVHEEIRRRVGPDFIVGIRYTMDEAMAGGLSAEDALTAAVLLERSGLINFFNVNYGRMDTAYSLVTDSMPTMSVRSAPFLAAAAQFKREIRLPIMHAAKIADLATARYAIEEGMLDLVGMTRAHIADPHIVRKLERGEEHHIRPCVGASFCRSHQAACIHNPSTGREDWLSHDVEPAVEPRNVTVVGGGIGGLEAARVAALRGHHVTLFEAAPKLGGQVLLAQLGSWRKDLIGIVDWRVSELQRLGVRVDTNVYADADLVRSTAPDVVIIATGGMPYTDEIAGAELCTTTFDALTTHQAGTKSAVVYDGTGRHAAYVCAERYADAGRDVTLVTLDRILGAELGGRGDELMWTKRFAELNLPIRHDLHLQEVSRKANGRLNAVFKHEMTAQIVEIETDEVVVEMGTTPIDDVFHDLRSESVNDGRPRWDRLLAGMAQDWPRREGSYELYRIGDAESSRDIHAAVLDAFRLARML
jgi:2,4-dienoyl-CoA reductase-like NADH-dependent reductase (Old Yellow Enzyme family)/thioredoxin reductase